MSGMILNVGPVPATTQMTALLLAVSTLAETHGALSAATVAEFEALGNLARARDEALALIAAEAIPALVRLRVHSTGHSLPTDSPAQLFIEAAVTLDMCRRLFQRRLSQ